MKITINYQALIAKVFPCITSFHAHSNHREVGASTQGTPFYRFKRGRLGLEPGLLPR